MTKTGEACETNIVSMDITTGKYTIYVCPSCKETFEHPETGTTSYGAEYTCCPYCKTYLRPAFYEVAE